MKVRVSRLKPDESVLVDVKEIWEDTVCWETKESLSKGVHPDPRYLPTLKCQIDYDYAVEHGLSTGSHTEIGERANVFLYETNNKEADCKEGYKYLCELAGRKPARYTGVPAGQPPCTKKILDELGTEKHLRADIRSCLMSLGYDEETIRRAFKSLEKKERIFFSSENHSLKNCEVWAAK